MKSKHTEGNWILDRRDPDRLYIAQQYGDEPGGRICEVFMNCLVREDGREANGRLIASAPDLLDFALFVLHGIQSGHIKAKPFLDFRNSNAESVEMQTIGNLAQNVIAKARGAA
jgi:hypothetical protein